jgi:SAM-dependent methyltransferase
MSATNSYSRSPLSADKSSDGRQAMTLPDGPWLNVGSGPSNPEPWINIDGSWQARLAGRRWLAAVVRRLTGRKVGHWPRGVRHRNIRRGLGCADNSVAVVYASHLIEHLYRDEAVAFLCEVRRVLKPGGVCRIVAPDVQAIVSWYLAHRAEPPDPNQASSDLLMNLLMLRRRGRPPGAESMRWLVGADGFDSHKWMYDGEGLTSVMRDAGFARAQAKGYLDSAIPREALERVEAADRVCNGAGVCAEARK